MSNKLSAKKRAFDWWDLTPNERFKAHLPINEDAFRETLSVLPVTFKKWKTEHKAYKEVEVATLEAKLETSDGDTKTKILDKLAELCLEDGTYRAGEVWLRATGNLVEKSESKVQFELSAGENIRIAREAEQRVSEVRREPDGDTGLSQEPPLLSEQVCVDSEQEHGEEG